MPREVNIDDVVVGSNGVPTAYASKISYLYRADGLKLQKNVYRRNHDLNVFVNQTTDYLTGFQYDNMNSKNGVYQLRFFPHKEGYVNNQLYGYESSPVFTPQYVYNHTDHLGNVRLSYQKNGTSTQIIEENNYYPFGLKHKGYNDNYFPTGYKYKYNGKEFQDELGLNVTSMDFRNYDNAIGRFNVQDRLSELAPMHNPYRFGFNNPVYWSDSSGLYETDKYGNISITDDQEIISFLNFLKNNENASMNDIATEIASSGNYSEMLPEVSIKSSKGKISRSEFNRASKEIHNNVQESNDRLSRFSGNVKTFSTWSTDMKYLWSDFLDGTVSPVTTSISMFGETLAGGFQGAFASLYYQIADPSKESEALRNMKPILTTSAIGFENGKFKLTDWGKMNETDQLNLFFNSATKTAVSVVPTINILNRAPDGVNEIITEELKRNLGNSIDNIKFKEAR